MYSNYLKQTIMMKKYIKPVCGAFLLVALIGFTSCEKMLNTDLEDAVPEDKNYQNDFDSRSAVLGAYGQYLALADQYVVLNELRGDLMDVTANASKDLVEINRHNVSSTNAYADATPFYKVILTCNDAAKHLLVMEEENRTSTFDRDYSEIVGLRCWIYYQLAIHYGKVPYITEPIEDVNDLDLNSYPELSLDVMVDTLINTLLRLPKLGQSDYGTANGYNISRDFVSKYLLLADLYLWQGNYWFAAYYYRSEMEGSDNAHRFMKFKCDGTFGYTISTNINKWNIIFDIKNQEASTLANEWKWYFVYEKDFNITNGLLDLLSYSYGKYQIKPSQLSIDNWGAQVLTNGSVGDIRGNGSSWEYDNGMPVAKKYLYSVTSTADKDRDIFIYRAGNFHLRFAEAANLLGQPDVALGIVNGKVYTDSACMNNANPVFNFNETFVATYWNDQFRDNKGVRGRVSLMPVTIPQQNSLEDSIDFVQKIIFNEDALELAYEGHRWPDYLRFALRMNRMKAGSGTEFLANGIARKFEQAGQPGVAAEVRSRLMNPDNWYLPLLRKKGNK
jgi:hypothetical protein